MIVGNRCFRLKKEWTVGTIFFVANVAKPCAPNRDEHILKKEKKTDLRLHSEVKQRWGERTKRTNIDTLSICSYFIILRVLAPLNLCSPHTHAALLDGGVCVCVCRSINKSFNPARSHGLCVYDCVAYLPILRASALVWVCDAFHVFSFHLFLAARACPPYERMCLRVCVRDKNIFVCRLRTHILSVWWGLW